MAIVAYVPDLMDRSKILEAAGDEVRFVTSPTDLAGAVAQPAVRAVVVDLARPGVLAVLPDIVASGVRVVGFGSHVDRDMLAAASRAGCSDVLARSVFFRRLPGLLAEPGSQGP